MDARNLAIVLVRPEHAGNVGATARALGNLGLSDLRLVAGVEPDAKARAMACVFQDILAAATRHATLASALGDCGFAVAMVSPLRPREQAPTELRSLTARIAERSRHGKVALVFGSEQSGLPHDDVIRCDAVASIPLPSPWPTLNLAQAVLLAGYELLCMPAAATPAPASLPLDTPLLHAEVDAVLRAVSQALTSLGYRDGEDSPVHGRILDRCRAIASRANLTRADVQMLYGLLARLGRVCQTHPSWSQPG